MEWDDRPQEPEFRGFRRPNYTPVPDELFDLLLPELREAELKALLYIVRRTFGFKKDSDAISLNQFLHGIRRHNGKAIDRGCGVRDRTTLTRALRDLEQKHIILSRKRVDERGESETTVYALYFVDDAKQPRDATRTHEEVVGSSYHRSGESLPPVEGDPDQRDMTPLPLVVGDSYSQETVKQQTDGQEREQQHCEDVVAMLLDLGVTKMTANALARRHPLERIKTQIEMLEYRRPRDRAAVLVQAIREDWALPAGCETSGQRDDVFSQPEELTEAFDEASSAPRHERSTWQERTVAQYGIDQPALDLWERVRQLLPRFVGPTAYKQFFADALMTPATRGRVKVIVPEQWQKTAIGPELRSALEDTLCVVLAQEVTVDILHSR